MPRHQDHLPDRQLRARHLLTALNVEFALSRLRLKAGFDPNQPRVPAGSPDGGRWTDTGASRRASEAVHGSARSSTSAAANPDRFEELVVVRDRTGEQPWSSYTERRRTDGTLVSRTVTNRDGSRIVGAIPSGSVERHEVTLRDGARFEFATQGDTQRILDGEGRLLSEAVWTAGGVEARPVVTPAFLDRSSTDKLLEAAAALRDWLSSTSVAGAAAVAVFNATEFLHRGGGRRLEVEWIGTRTADEIGRIWEKFGLVQEMTDNAAASSPRNAYRNEAVRGTAIHLKVKNEVDKIRSESFRAELSILKATEITRAGESDYGLKDTIRIDVFERLGDIVCVYDLKTGRRGLSAPRIRKSPTMSSASIRQPGKSLF